MRDRPGPVNNRAATLAHLTKQLDRNAHSSVDAVYDLAAPASAKYRAVKHLRGRWGGPECSTSPGKALRMALHLKIFGVEVVNAHQDFFRPS